MLKIAKKRDKNRQRNSSIKFLTFIFTFALVFHVAANNAIGITVYATSSLPSGCKECVSNTAYTFNYGNQGTPNKCTNCTDWGCTEWFLPPTATYSACYENTQWEFRLDTVTYDYYTSSCNITATNVCTQADVDGLTKAQACAAAAEFTYNSGTYNWQTYKCEDIIVKHEQYHVDNYKSYLDSEFNAFETWVENQFASINCTDNSTLTCQSALTAKTASFNTELAARELAAWRNYFPGREARAYANGGALFAGIKAMLDTKCNSP